MKRFATYVGSILAVLSVCYLIFTFIQDFENLPQPNIDPLWLFTVAATSTLFIVNNILGAIAWHRLMYLCGASTELLTVFYVYLTSQAAKYFPGNVAHQIGRVAMAKHMGFPIKSVLLSMTLEVCFSAAVGAVIIIPTTSFDRVSELGLNIEHAKFLIALFTVILVIVLSIFITRRQICGANPKLNFLRIFLISLFPLFQALFCLFIPFLICGGIIVIISKFFFGLSGISFWKSSGIFALAWIMGFITPGAPAGIGIREIVLTFLLDPFLGTAALSISILMRIITTIGDTITFVIGVLVKYFIGKSSRFKFHSSRV